MSTKIQKWSLNVTYTVLMLAVFGTLSGCWLVAAGAGAEAGYIIAQEDRTASETIGDQAIVSSVKMRLLADQEVSGFDIKVSSHKGIVTLRGGVDTHAEANKAITIARNVSGVNDVVSQIFVN